MREKKVDHLKTASSFEYNYSTPVFNLFDSFKLNIEASIFCQRCQIFFISRLYFLIEVHYTYVRSDDTKTITKVVHKNVSQGCNEGRRS